MEVHVRVPNKHKPTVPVVKERRYIHPQKYRDGCCKVTNYSSLSSLEELRNKLVDHEKAMFRTTAIGHLLDVPKQMFSAALFSYLLSREIAYPVEPEGKAEENAAETWFRVCDKDFGFGKEWDKKKKGSYKICDNPCDKDLCFGKLEFASISGLSLRKPDQACMYISKPSTLKTRYFSTSDSITGFHLRYLLFGKKVKSSSKTRKSKGEKDEYEIEDDIKVECDCSSEDRVKVALLYFVHFFLLGHQDDAVVEDEFWHLVDNLSEFNKYPWGELVYDRTITRSRSALVYQINNNNKEGYPTFKSQGLAQVLVVWALQIFPGLLQRFGEKNDSTGFKPHILTVLCTKVVHHKSIIRSLNLAPAICESITEHAYDSLEEMIGAGLGPFGSVVMDAVEEKTLAQQAKESLETKASSPQKQPDVSCKDSVGVEDRAPETNSTEEEPHNAPSGVQFDVNCLQGVVKIVFDVLQKEFKKEVVDLQKKMMDKFDDLRVQFVEMHNTMTEKITLSQNDNAYINQRNDEDPPLKAMSGHIVSLKQCKDNNDLHTPYPFNSQVEEFGKESVVSHNPLRCKKLEFVDVDVVLENDEEGTPQRDSTVASDDVSESKAIHYISDSPRGICTMHHEDETSGNANYGDDIQRIADVIKKRKRVESMYLKPPFTTQKRASKKAKAIHYISDSPKGICTMHHEAEASGKRQLW